MFEAKLAESATLKKILDAVKDLVNEASWECTPNGMSLQAMDTSHVSLVSILLKSDGSFERYRCDRNLTLGMHLGNLSKILKCASNDDVVTIKAADEADKITLTFEAKNESEISEYEVKLMNLDSEYLGIPDTEYIVDITIPAQKFQRICKDLGQLGDSITISCAKDGVRFAANGELGSGNIKLNKTASADKPEEAVVIKMQEPICLSFAAKYLNHFAKATPLASKVQLQMAPDVPLVVKYVIEDEDGSEIGHISYYLAPKIDEDTME